MFPFSVEVKGLQSANVEGRSPSIDGEDADAAAAAAVVKVSHRDDGGGVVVATVRWVRCSCDEVDCSSLVDVVAVQMPQLD